MAQRGCKTHGLTRINGKKRTEYIIWTGIKQRCLNPNQPAYPDYGGRGITVCDRWRDSFLHFFQDMGPRPGPEYTVDRVDNEKGYSPENCVWATQREQRLNQRLNSLAANKQQRVREARIQAVHFLHACDYTTREISDVVGLGKSYVHKLVS